MVLHDGWTGPPVVTYAYQQSVLKEEDVLLVNPSQAYPADKSVDASSSLRSTELNGFAYRSLDSRSGGESDAAERPANCGLFVVCDGHNGVTAAQYVADQLPAYLDDLLPLGEPPDESDAKAFLVWRQGLQRALTISLALLHRAFAGQGVLAGCTVTIVLQHGWLLTCANLGDSRAIVDTGREVTVLTDDHRVATHKLERRRLEQKGSTIAPVDLNGGGPAQGKGAVGVGPLRLWPGGLCLSRAIGDFDVGDSVLSLPYISQVRVPPEGARLLVASDGVWDAFMKTARVASIARSAATQSAPQRVITSIMNAHDGIKDDTSLVVVDLLPPGKSFSECTRSFADTMSCSCIGGSNSKARDPDAVPPQVEVLERVDTAQLAGLMPDQANAQPAWFTAELAEELTDTMEQAMDIWEKASGMRRQGRAPSIADFEQLLVAAKLEKTSVAAVAAKFSPEDMSVRMGGNARVLPKGGAVPPKSTTVHLMPHSDSNSSMSDNANPSVRFGNAVATSEEFGGKFGHYGRQPHQSLDAGPSTYGRNPGPIHEEDLQRGSAERREAFMDGRAFNPHLMKTMPKPAPPPKPHTPADDYSVRAGQEAVYRTPAPGTSGGGQAINYSVRAGAAKPVVNPDVVKTFMGSSVPASPPKQGLLRTSIDSLRRLSVGAVGRKGSGSSDTLDAAANFAAGHRSGGDSDSSVGRQSSKEGSYGKHHRRVPMTELQSGMPPSAMRTDSKDGERVHGGKATKSVAFSDSAREPTPLGDVAES